jgi:hypothetical protein
MNPCNIFIRDTEKGKAVFADKDFAFREFICEFSGRIHTKEEYIRLYDPCNNHFLQFDEGHFLGPSDGADDFINHSCNPNCGLEYREGGIRLVAIREIQKGEEITFDYSTTMDEDCWEMECLCGDENCRRVVRDFKHLPRELQRKYIDLGVVPGFIARKFNPFR